jgi:hypothetical protein
MKKILILAAIMATTVSACGGSSSSSVSGPGSATYITETFTTDSATDLASYSIAGPQDVNPDCIPDTDSNTPLPEGILVYKKGEAPTRLVVFAHGIGNNVRDSWLPHMTREIRLAKSFENQPSDVAFVSTDYRDNLGFPTLRGAHDTITATRYAMEKFPSIATVYMFGVSMGGAVSGTAIIESTAVTEDGSSLYDYWLDVEGVSQLAETYTEATAAASISETAAQAQAGIERDTGGNPVTCPLAFARRSPAYHAAEMKLAGLRAATVIHAINDGLVPHNQARVMASTLTTSGIPTQFFTIVGIPAGQDPGTTGTGTAGAGDADPYLNLAGHASESQAYHPVMRVAFENMRKMLDGSYNETVPYFECIVDPNIPSDSCQVDQIQP